MSCPPHVTNVSTLPCKNLSHAFCRRTSRSRCVYVCVFKMVDSVEPQSHTKDAITHDTPQYRTRTAAVSEKNSCRQHLHKSADNAPTAKGRRSVRVLVMDHYLLCCQLLEVTDRVAGRRTWYRFNISDSLMACFRMLSRSASAMASAPIVSMSGARAAMRAKDASMTNLHSHSIDNVTTIMVCNCSYHNGVLPGFIQCDFRFDLFFSFSFSFPVIF